MHTRSRRPRRLLAPARIGGIAAVTLLALQLAPVPAAAALDCSGTTPIHEIQGAGHVSPYLGMEVETCGVVTAIAFNGYYLQDPDGDGVDATSDGLFVFQFGNIPEVGELLRLRDTVTEFIPGGAGTGNLSITQLSFPDELASEPGHPLPSPVVIGGGGRVPPNEIVISDDELPVNLQDPMDAAANEFDPTADGIDFYESLEGMRVTIEEPVAVSAIRQFGTFSAEVFVLANRGRDIAPRDARTARGGINLQPDPDNRGDQNPERVQIQFDGTLFGSTDYPAIQVGDRLGGVTGVVGYSFGNFEVNALGPFPIHPSRSGQETAFLPSIRGIGPPGHAGPVRRFLTGLPVAAGRALTVASYNVLNLSAVAGDDAQRTEIARQIADHLRAPDVIALQEIQDNDGDDGDGDTPCPDPSDCPAGELDASGTLQALVDAIADAGGPDYDFLTVDPLVETTDDNRDDPDAFGGVALGNIRNAFLYNPRRVDLVEFTGLTREILRSRGVSAYRAFDSSRDPLEAVFDFRGQRVTILNNHFSSRFGSTPIFGGPQPFVQAAEDTREAQSRAMHEATHWLLERDDDAHVIVLGDLNTFEFTNDLTEILPAASGERILFNLLERNRGDNRYSFIFEGNSQMLDHVFVTEDLYRRARFDIVHVNVDFPRRFGDTVGSDHEPLVAAFRFPRPVAARFGNGRW